MAIDVRGAQVGAAEIDSADQFISLGLIIQGLRFSSPEHYRSQRRDQHSALTYWAQLQHSKATCRFEVTPESSSSTLV